MPHRFVPIVVRHSPREQHVLRVPRALYVPRVLHVQHALHVPRVLHVPHALHVPRVLHAPDVWAR